METNAHNYGKCKVTPLKNASKDSFHINGSTDGTRNSGAFTNYVNNRLTWSINGIKSVSYLFFFNAPYGKRLRKLYF